MAFDKDQVKFALVYQFLSEVDQELAQKFKKKHKPANLGNLTTLFNEMISHFINTNENGKKVVEKFDKLRKSLKKKMPAKVPSEEGNRFSNKEDGDDVPRVQIKRMSQKKSNVVKTSRKKTKSSLNESESSAKISTVIKPSAKKREESSSEDEALKELPIIESVFIKLISAGSNSKKSSSKEKQPNNKAVPIKSKSVEIVQMKTTGNSQEATEEESKPATKTALATNSILMNSESCQESSFVDKKPAKKSVRKAKCNSKQSDCKDAPPAKSTKEPTQPVVKSSSSDARTDEESTAPVKQIVTATEKSSKTKINSIDESSSSALNKAPAKKDSSVEESSEDKNLAKGLKRKADDAGGAHISKKNKFSKFVKPEQNFNEHKNNEENGEKLQSRNKFGGRGGRGRGGFRKNRNNFNPDGNVNRDDNLIGRNKGR